MARNELLAMITDGRLRPGTVLLHRPKPRNADRHVEAIVVPAGIRLRGHVFTSPSAAAKSVGGTKTNGWNFWRVRDTGVRLAELRKG